MPRFYFDIADGRTIKVEEGADFSDLEAAKSYAVSAVRDIVKHETWQGRLPLNECIRIRGERDQLLHVVRFRDALNITL